MWTGLGNRSSWLCGGNETVINSLTVSAKKKKTKLNASHAVGLHVHIYSMTFIHKTDPKTNVLAKLSHEWQRRNPKCKERICP